MNVLNNVNKCSTPTTNRYIKKARTLGAIITSTKNGNTFYFTLENKDEVKAITTKWLEFERKNKLIGDQ